MDGEAFNRPDKVEFTDGPWRTALTGMGADIEFRISFLKSGKMMTEEYDMAVSSFNPVQSPAPIDLMYILNPSGVWQRGVWNLK